ncbi:aldose epimerase family protein [Maribacter hydrothermalis]|uniref:Aldose epimerase n=1 Tax=Maribacter hydrothermalis TaxID=1836467 RepID=A0A1B7ZCA2_9FLAO|nr:aldose epimerase [Maribacter hydrothermalis]APQ18006.1 aldose epimerase [Maribacter hydrothermalis]OBR40547.1 aldose epimerase [Maribacter hydrothermalis]
MSKISILKVGNHQVTIEAGELVGYQVSGHEFMHQKGNPGWRSVDTEMFPIIGPTNEADFKINTPKGFATQDQHGLLREMKYSLKESSANKAVFVKTYKANTTVLNSKYPAKSTEEKLSWPYNFEFVKSFELKDNALTVTFSITGDKGMPFMLGYHPAFMLHTTNAVISTENKDISIDEVMAVGSRALYVPNTNVITLNDEKKLQISTVGFNHFMLWTEVPNMVCIEPITFYPYAVEQKDLSEGFLAFKNNSTAFKVSLKPM